MRTVLFFFGNGTRATIRGTSWGKIMGQALFLARDRSGILRYEG